MAVSTEILIRGDSTSAQRAMEQAQRSMRNLERASQSLNRAMNVLKGAITAAFAAISTQKIIDAADEYTNFTNKVKLATKSLEEQKAVQGELFRISQKTGQSIGDTSKLYSKIILAADQLNASQSDVLKVTEIVNKSLAASGTTAEEASGALTQMGQAFNNSSRVMAEEYNSIQEAMPGLLKEVTKQLGLQAGTLKKYVTEGKLSNKQFFDAILKTQKAIDGQFAQATQTISQSMTQLSNAFVMLVGNFEESTGTFAGIAKAISFMAENMDELVRILKALAIGFGIAFSAKIVGMIREVTSALIAMGTASKANIVGLFTAIGFYVADATVGLDKILEKLGLIAKEAHAANEALSGADLSRKPSTAVDPLLDKINKSIDESYKKAMADAPILLEHFRDLWGAANQWASATMSAEDALAAQLKSVREIEKAQRLIAFYQKEGVRFTAELNMEKKTFDIEPEKLTEEQRKQLDLIEKQIELRAKLHAELIEYMRCIQKTMGTLFDAQAWVDLGDVIAMSFKDVGAALDMAMASSGVGALLVLLGKLIGQLEIFQAFMDVISSFMGIINSVLGIFTKALKNLSAAMDRLAEAIKNIDLADNGGELGYIFGGGLAKNIESQVHSALYGGTLGEKNVDDFRNEFENPLIDAQGTNAQFAAFNRALEEGVDDFRESAEEWVAGMKWQIDHSPYSEMNKNLARAELEKVAEVLERMAQAAEAFSSAEEYNISMIGCRRIRATQKKRANYGMRLKTQRMAL